MTVETGSNDERAPAACYPANPDPRSASRSAILITPGAERRRETRRGKVECISQRFEEKANATRDPIARLPHHPRSRVVRECLIVRFELCSDVMSKAVYRLWTVCPACHAPSGTRIASDSRTAEGQSDEE
jgi:hypothetical protein